MTGCFTKGRDDAETQFGKKQPDLDIFPLWFLLWLSGLERARAEDGNCFLVLEQGFGTEVCPLRSLPCV
ncbi:hypothetical protein AV530_004416 [Patagioenas fasciata monilis]|uniref:Uncharacterized protein n=1 Tax=Patagioenas fasciata monilis TaxID=372326 RepID=A0A1V4J1H7_PATFA|nr:hypothetical protein AV530_004416 [Patagioenas fasciata monilis]